MPKSPLSAPDGHQAVEDHPAYNKSIPADPRGWLSEQSVRSIGHSALRDMSQTPNLNKAFMERDAEKSLEISDAVPRRK